MVAKNKRLLNSINYRNADGSFNFQPADTATLASDPVTGQITAVLPAGVNVYATPGNLPLTNVNTGQIAFAESNNKMYIWTGTGWISITTVNRAPQITVEPNAAYSFALDGTPIILSLDAIDSDQTPITWSYTTTGLANIATISQDSSQFTITPSTNDSDAGSFTMTFIASDGINSDTAQAIFSLVFVSEYWKDVVLNIGTSSTPGRRNSTYIDRSIYAATLSANTATTPTQTAFHPYLENWSVEFNNTNIDYLEIDGNGVNLLGSGDFTVEAWVYLTTAFATTNTRGIMSQYPGSGATGNNWILGFRENRVRVFYAAGLSAIGTTDISFNRWHHVAWTRSGSDNYVFLDGNLETTFTNSADYSGLTTAADQFEIGTWGGGDVNSWGGYISNARIVKGTAVYTSAFTPPTSKLTAITGTEILACQGNRFGNALPNYLITPFNSPKISAFNPFGQPEAYTINNNLGSAYFKPSIDSHITSTYTTNYYDWWTEDYTIEAWIYPLSLTGWHYTDGVNVSSMIGNAQVGASINYWSFGPISDGTVRFYYYNGSPQTNLTSTETVKINQWNHIAMVKNSSGVKIFVNGVGTSYLTINGTPQSNTGSPLTIGRISATNIQGYVSDLKISKGTAAYMADFTPPTGALTNTNATFYLPMDNAGIFDTTGNNTLEIVGDVTTSSTQTKFADTAMYFDGSGDYLTVPDSSLFAFGSGDFTIEAWIYASSLGAFNGVIGQWPSDGGSANNSFVLETVDTNIDFYWVSGTTLYGLTDIGTIALNQWIHVAVARNGNSIYGFINGSLAKTGSITQTLNDPSSAITVGGNIAGGGMWNGYIENLQILKGVAKYTANFTPPTVPQNIQNQLTS